MRLILLRLLVSCDLVRLLHHLGDFMLIHEKVLGGHDLARLKRGWVLVWHVLQSQLIGDDT